MRMRVIISTSALLLGVWLASSFALAGKPKVIEDLHGKVLGVIDGDTLTLHTTGKPLSIRLEGIDAPESGQKFGGESREALKKLVAGKDVTVHKTGVDKYNRTLGTVIVDKVDVCQKMVEEGWAWHFKKYSTDEDLAKLEEEAKSTKRGLWQDKDPTAPWDFRAAKSEVAKTTPSTSPSPLESIPKPAPAAPTAPTFEPQAPASGGGSGMVWVNGYTRKNGTVVKGYWRRK